jgi:hypothetical protein
VAFGSIVDGGWEEVPVSLEAEAIRRFLSWVEPAGEISKADAAAARTILDKYESSVRQSLDRLDATLQGLVWVYGDFTLSQPRRREDFE